MAAQLPIKIRWELAIPRSGSGIDERRSKGYLVALVNDRFFLYMVE